MASLQYRATLDGLRAIAVLSILVYHLNRGWLPGGFVGVDVFFVISGFLITSIIVREADAVDFSLLRFYQRRIARILPAFVVMALVTLLAAWWVYAPQDLALAGGYMAAAALSATNLKLIFQGSYFALLPDAHPYMHCWSLSVEEQFYFIFPFLIFIFQGRLRPWLFPVLLVAALASFAGCLLLTWHRPGWAFYLLPARAWELLAGGLLAVGGIDGRGIAPRIVTQLQLPWVGLALVAAGLLITREAAFPGYQALLPVLGTVCLIAGTGATTSGAVARFLGSRPMVGIGKVSYSLYLWHWPVFCLTDYHLLEFPETSRVVVKVVATTVLALASFSLVERPARVRLGRAPSRGLAYAFLGACLLVCVPLGLTVQRRNYVNAKNGAEGRLVFNPHGKAGTMVLMGDSHGSMYGKTVREFAEHHGFKLIVTSSAALDALPPKDAAQPSLWNDSLAIVDAEKPDFVVLACAWLAYLDPQGERLRKVVDTLAPKTGTLILITQPPELPPSATRANLRNGARPPFLEEPEIQHSRNASNEQVRHAVRDNVRVIDMEPMFGHGSGDVPFFDDQDRPLYHDKSHLSDYGTRRIRPELERLIGRK